MLRNFLYANTKMVKSDYTILILVIMKECPIALVQIGKCRISKSRRRYQKVFWKNDKGNVTLQLSDSVEKSDNNIVDRQMSECSGCRGWFYRMCERILAAIFRETVKIGPVFNALLMKKFNIWKPNTLFLRCCIRDI